MRLSRFLCSVIISLGISQSSYAEKVAYEFTGTVFFSFTPPYGLTVNNGDPVSGRFIYENTTTSTHSCGDDCSGYQQLIPGGFTATIGTVKISADDYLVEVANDVEQQSGETNDFITVRWASDFAPSLDPLDVNEVSRTSGLFRIDLPTDASTFPDTDLPLTLDPNSFSFPAQTGLFADTPTGLVDALFSINSLIEVAVPNADFDGDLDVDGQDFLTWQVHNGSAGPDGDANANSLVDSDDLFIWQTQFGNASSALAQLGLVPEPGCLELISCFGLLMLAQTRRRELAYSRYV